LQPATCNLQPTANLQPPPAALDDFNRKYSTISRPFRYDQLNNRFTQVIHEIMKNQSLTPQQAIDAMWLEARRDTWSSSDRFQECIADYAALPPPLAHARPPVSVGRPQSPPRYYRPVPPETSTSPNDCRPGVDEDPAHSRNLTSTQLFTPAGRHP